MPKSNQKPGDSRARKAFLLFAFGLWLLATPTFAVAQAAVFVVRHAERADTSADSVLSPVGEARAVRLGEILKDAGIGQIYTTNLRRTVQTAAPLAAALRLTPTSLPVNDLDGLFARLQSTSLHDRVLVVGHSNTVPQILQRLGVAAPVTIRDAEYDNLFIAIPQKGSSALFVQLRY